MNYTLEQFIADSEALRPRAFDTYILPAFLIFYAIRSKAGMGRKARRILFTAGALMTLRSLATYRTAVAALRARLSPEPEVEPV